MEITGIGMSRAQYATLQTQTAKVDDKTATDKKDTVDAAAEKAVENNQDKFVKSTDKTGSGVYSKNTLNSSQLDQLKNDQEQRVQSFQKMLQSMLVKQGQKSNYSMFGKDFNITQDNINSAKASISEGGEYSVDAVATRLIDMAKALSGGDPSKIGELRNAVMKGFKAAGVELGGKLPSISNDTYDEVMSRFDDWENESKTPLSTNSAVASGNAASVVAD